MIAKISVSIVVQLGIHTSICTVYGNVHYVATYIIQKFSYGKKVFSLLPEGIEKVHV